MSAKHTPGPWEVRERDGVLSIHAPGNTCPAQINGDPSYLPEIRLNARLIAAAPDLLEALQAVMASCGAEGRYSALELHDAANRARAAIAKATGSETPDSGEQDTHHEQAECLNCGWRGRLSAMTHRPGQFAYASALVCPSCGHARFVPLCPGQGQDSGETEDRR